jgi:hypothetical protein
LDPAGTLHEDAQKIEFFGSALNWIVRHPHLLSLIIGYRYSIGLVEVAEAIEIGRALG